MGRAQAGGWRQSLQPKGLLNVSQWLWQQEQLGSETEVGTLIIDDLFCTKPHAGYFQQN